MWKDKISGGLADKLKPFNFDKSKLKDGVKVELEHTNNKHIAQEIAMDHLKEDSRYYNKLKEMEMKKASVDLNEFINNKIKEAGFNSLQMWQEWIKDNPHKILGGALGMGSVPLIYSAMSPVTNTIDLDPSVSKPLVLGSQLYHTRKNIQRFLENKVNAPIFIGKDEVK